MADGRINIYYQEHGLDNLKGLDELNKIADAESKLSDTLQAGAADAMKAMDSYGDSVEDAAKDLTNYVNQQKEARATIKNAAKDYKIFGTTINDIQAKQQQLAKSYKVLSLAVGGSTKGLKLFRLALLSTGVGVLVIALGSLVRFLTSTQKGINIVNKSMAQLRAITTVLGDRFEGMGEAIFNAITNPQKALNTFVDLLKSLPGRVLDNISNRFTALGNTIDLIFKGKFSEAAKASVDFFTGIEDTVDKTVDGYNNLKDATVDIVEEIRREVAITGQLEDAKVRLRNAQNELIVLEAKLGAEIKSTNRIAEDVTKTFEERLTAINRTEAANKELLDARLGAARENLRIMQAEAALSDNLAETERELAEARARIFSIEAEYQESATTFQNRRNALYDQQKAKLEEIRLEMEKLAKIQREGEVDGINQLVKVLEEAAKKSRDLKTILSDTGGQLLSEDSIVGVESFVNAFGEKITKEFIKNPPKITLDIDTSGGTLDGPNFVDNIRDGILTGFEKLDGLLASDEFAAFKLTFDSITTLFTSSIDKQIAGINELIAARDNNIRELDSQLKEEEDRQKKGLSNNVDSIKQALADEVAAKKKAQEEAQQLQKEAQRFQLINDSIQQASSLITAGAQIFKGFSSIPIVGLPLGIAAVAALIGAFAKLKLDSFAATQLYTGTQGNQIQDFFGQPTGSHSDKPGSGGKGLSLVDNATGRPVGVTISGKEALVTEQGTGILGNLLTDVELNPSKYAGRDLVAELDGLRIPKLGSTVRSLSNYSTTSNRERGITATEMEQILEEQNRMHEQKMKQILEDIPQWLFLPKGVRGDIFKKSKNKTTKIRVSR